MDLARLNQALFMSIDDLPVDEDRGSLEARPFMRVCLVRDTESVVDLLEESDDVEPEDLDYLADQVGFILTALPDGTATVRYFADEDRLDDRWNDLCENILAEDDEDAEESEEDEEEE